MNKVLIVDDDRSIRLSLSIFLEREGYKVKDVASGSAALSMLREFHPDVVLTDLRLKEESGIDVLAALKERQADLPVILMTAYGTVEKAVEAMKLGAVDFISKPFQPAEMAQLIRRTLELHQLRAENRALRSVQGQGEFLTHSGKLNKILDAARRVAQHDTTVLLTGESGTGKSLLARQIHQWSPRSSYPFIEVNCAALSTTLLESELFGHARGAFTGAVKDKVGRLEAAAGGTLFLDEIGEIPLELQAKLLRFIQDRQFERVGEVQARKVDVRIICATNRDLVRMVAAGTFREDLFYRISVFDLNLPPLRERREDIGDLARQFLADAALRNRVDTAPAIAPDVLQVLEHYDWPGNIRELQNVMERAFILSGSSDIRLEHLPDRLVAETMGMENRMAAGNRQAAITPERIRAVLGASSTLEEAADTLGISVTTLWRKRKEFGIA